MIFFLLSGHQGSATPKVYVGIATGSSTTQYYVGITTADNGKVSDDAYNLSLSRYYRNNLCEWVSVYHLVLERLLLWTKV